MFYDFVLTKKQKRTEMAGKMAKIAVIGAGASGITATKCLTEPNSGFECTTFELSNSVGGTWVYTEDVGKDKFGLPVHSSMYQGLNTNLPKQIMALPDLPFKGRSNASYVSSDEVLEYFNEYVDHFNLRKYIKLQHHVNHVTPIDEGRWEIRVTDLVQQKEVVDDFDAVIICTGNYSNPVIPNYPNREQFKGMQFHSHDYKHPSRLKDMRTLVIGAGASALDVAVQGSKWATKIYLSHHKEELKNINFSDNVSHKPDVREITENGAIFVDGTQVELDAIVYCTGYEHHYPFLDPACKVRVEDGVVKPLYKHFVNIEHPSMFFIGVPRDCPGFALFQVQARCMVTILKGESTLPSKDKMYAEVSEEYEERLKKIGSMRGYHRLREPGAQLYFDSLSELGKLPKTPRICFEIYFSGLKYMLKDFANFRKRIYHMLDEEKYTITMPTGN